VSDEQQEITPAELAAAKVADPSIQLVDVREPWEVAIVALPDAIVLPLRSLPDLTDAIDPDLPVVVYCHHGTRSEQGRAYLAANGWPDARNLTGGIDAYARDVDPSLPRY